jgi:hypothetical protein
MTMEMGHDLATTLREIWHKGTVVEYCPPALRRWVPALITASDCQTLDVEFMLDDVCSKQTIPQTTPLIALFNTHKQEMPPGFSSRDSKSRPGEKAFVDSVTGSRYGSIMLAWKVYLERMHQMESLPTVCDTRLPSNHRFIWPESCTANESEVESTHGKESTEAGIKSTDIESVDIDNAFEAWKPTTDVFFSSNVLAEMIAAPSPAVLPLAMFKKFNHTSDQLGHEEKKSDIAASDFSDLTARVLPSPPQWNVRPSPLEEITVPYENVLPANVDYGEPKSVRAQGDERVAELEGALEACRDRLKYLETTLRKHLGSEEIAKIMNSHGPDDLLGSAQCDSVLHTDGPSNQIETAPQSPDKDSANQSSTLDRMFAIEKELLNKACRIAGVRRTADFMFDNFETLEDYKRRFADLEQEIHERESRPEEANQFTRKQGPELEDVMKVRMEGNAKFREQLSNWESQLVGSPCSRVSSTPRFLASDLETPPKVLGSHPVAPPKATRSKAQVPLPRARTPPRSPSPHKSAGKPDSRLRCVSPAATPSRRGPSRRTSSVHGDSRRTSSVHGDSRRTSSVRGDSPDCAGSLRGSPRSMHGFRTPPRSLSPSTFRAPAKELRNGRLSSVSGSSIRSSVCGSSATVPCIPSPDGKALRASLVQKTTYFQPFVRVAPQWRSVGIPTRVGVGCAGEVTWRTTYQTAFA